MSEKYKNKYTIKSARLAGYNYSQNGMYFVTICAKNREEFFGEIKNSKMILSDVGKIAEQFWREIPLHFSFVNLDEYVVMPNHVHGVLEICDDIGYVETQFIASHGMPDAINPELGISSDAMGISSDAMGISSDAINRVSTDKNIKKSGGITGMNNPLLNQGSLSNIIRWYKGRCAFEIRKQLDSITFAWQSRFYDHIIRNEISLNKIREYVKINPAMWERDRNNMENLRM